MKMKSFILPVVFSLLIVVAGCERYIDSQDPVRSLPDNGPLPVNVTVQLYDGSVRLSWEVTDTSAVVMYRIFSGQDAQSELLLRDSTTELFIEMSGLLVNQSYFFQVAAVTADGLMWERSEVVSASVSYLSIDINNGDTYTNDRQVSVQVSSAVPVTHIQLSEDSAFVNTPFVPLSGASRNIEVSDGDGVKVLYARLQFSDGSTSGGLLIDSITLDTRATINSLSLNSPINGLYHREGETVIFTLDAGEADGVATVSFSGQPSLALRDDGVGADVVAGDGMYTGSWLVPGNTTINNGVVQGSFTDAAGNRALPFVAHDLLNVVTLPPEITLTVAPLSTFEISLNWTQTTSTNFAAYRVYRSMTPAVNESSTLLTSISSPGQTSYNDVGLDHNTRYYYRVYVVDKSGLNTPSSIESATTHVNTAPQPVALYSIENGDSLTIDLSWTSSDEIDFASYRVYRSTTSPVDTTGTLVFLGESAGNTLLISTLPNVPSGSSLTYYFAVWVFDRHGAATGSNEVSAPAPEDAP